MPIALTHSREEYATKLRKAKKEDSIKKKRLKAAETNSLDQNKLGEILMKVEPRLLNATITKAFYQSKK